MSFGCRGQEVRLTCPTDVDSRITVRSATYGSFFVNCSGSCCPPHAYKDCKDTIWSASHDLFDYFQKPCNGNQSCSFDFNGYMMRSSRCNGKNADYLQVFYDCSHIPHRTVAFMVRNLERSSLNRYDVVPWRDVVTNLGGHYYPQT